MEDLINKDSLIKLGGNLWEKGNMSRVYLNEKVLNNMGFRLVVKDHSETMYADEFRALGKNCKIWFDCKTEELHSTEGRIRSLFANKGIRVYK